MIPDDHSPEDHRPRSNLGEASAHGEQTSLAHDQTFSARDQDAADRDQAASDRDQAVSDDESARGRGQDGYGSSRATRDRATQTREATSSERHHTAQLRDETARERDLALARSNRQGTYRTIMPAQSTVRSIARRPAANQRNRPARRRSHSKTRTSESSQRMTPRGRRPSVVTPLEIALRLPDTGYRPRRIALSQQPSVKTADFASRPTPTDAAPDSERWSARSTVRADSRGYSSWHTSISIIAKRPPTLMIKMPKTNGSNISSG